MLRLPRVTKRSSRSAEELFAAIRNGDAAAVERLLTADPALSAAIGPDGLTALMLARYFSYSRTEILERLIAARGEDGLDIFEAAATGRTARVRALIAGDLALARAWSTDGFTPLHLAAFFGAEAAAEVLLEAGADPDVASLNDQRVHPLHSAVAGRSFGIARMLVDAGADVEAAQQRGFRPLHAAAQNGDELTVDLLLMAGARPWTATDQGKIAADFAAEGGHEVLADRLRAAAHGG
jgi:ankyrin repeat protein